MSHGGNLSLRELNNYEIMYEGIERGGFAWRLHGVRLTDSNKLAYSDQRELPTAQMREHWARPLCGSFWAIPKL